MNVTQKRGTVKTIRNAVACAALFLCFGCQSSVLVDEDQVHALPGPDEAPELYLPYSPTDYKLEVGDHIQLQSYYDPQLDQQMIVRGDGRVSLLLIGEVHVQGLSVAEVEERVVAKYAKTLDSPEVSVMLRYTPNRQVFIGGQIKKPSMQVLNGPLTLLEAASMSGGFLDTANLSQVLLLRPAGDGSGGHRVHSVDVKAILGNEAQDVFLRSHDVVYVPRSFIANVNLFVDQWINRMIPYAFNGSTNVVWRK